MRTVLLIFGLWVTTLSVFAQCSGANLVTNGNFSAGNTGFSTSYTYNATSCYAEGVYSIATSGNAVHAAFCTTGDHTSGSGNYMIINGAPSITNVWCQNMAVTTNTWYRFSFWGMNVCAICGDAPQFSISINGTPATDPCATFVFNTICNWKYYEVYWHSGTNTSANICITNLNTYLGGNDFALDDIEFRSCSSGGPCSAFLPTAPVLDFVKANENEVQIGFWLGENIAQNHKIFIERRTQNYANFEEIAQIHNPKVGTSSFVDTYPVFNQELYYRVKSIDKDGNVQYSNIRSIIVKKQDKSSLRLYPNPAMQNENIVLTYEGNVEKIISITLTDMTGRTVYYQENAGTLFENSQMRIPVQLNTGCYLLTTRFTDRTEAQKLLVY